MYQPWGDPGADDIIKLIEEKERKEVNYSSYENDSGNWNIVSYKELGGVTERGKPEHEVIDQETPGEHWRQDRGQVALIAPESSSHGGSIQPADKPVQTWGSKIADTLNSQFRTEINVELTVKKQSKINTNLQRIARIAPPRSKKLQRRSRSRSQSPPKSRKLQRRSRSRSQSPPRSRKLQRRSRSRSQSLQRSKKLQRRSRSRSQSLPRDKKPQRRSRSRSQSLPRSKKLERRSRSRSQSLPRSKKLQRRSRSRSQSLPRSKKSQRRSRSRSQSLPRVKKPQRRSRSRSRSQPRNKKLQRQTRSRSRSVSRVKKPRRHSRSRSHSRSKKQRSRSRSISRGQKRSTSRDRKREKSDSRDRKRQSNNSRDRKANSSIQYKSRSRSFEKKSDSPSPRRRSPTPKAPEKPAENTNEMFSKFLTMMQDVKKEQPAPPAKTIPNPNALPEFDSSNNGHSIVTWLLRIDDIARLLEWDEKETIQHALPKLMGDAKTWYQTLETVPYTWAEWRKTLKQQFPSPSFCRLLNEMYTRQATPRETLEKYYYDKILLVNRCGFKGRQAVDCILHGINSRAIRKCAEAADFSEPEEVLKYLKSVENIWPENKQSKFIKLKESELVTERALKRRNMTCFRCGQQGHKDARCWLKKLNSNPDTTNANPTLNKKYFQTASESTQPCEIQQLVPPQCQPESSQSQSQPPLPQSQPPLPLFQPQRPQFQPRPTQFQTRPPDLLPKPRFKPPQRFQSTPTFHPRQTNKLYKPPKERKAKLCFNCRVAGHVVSQCPQKLSNPMTSKSTDSSITVTETSVETPITPSTDNIWTEPGPPGVE